jgi:succinate-semialdehyde dehydrogenase/glutarate-semialdehyde dehydrogenase
MKYRNSGQICITPTRFFVHESINDKFLERFCEAVGNIKIGNGLDPSTTMGPLAHERRLGFVGGMIEDAVACGAKALQGGQAVGGDGYFWEPTVLADVPDSARIMSEEPFGPVAVTQQFSTFDEAVQKANSVPYGLSGYAFSQSVRTCADIADALEVGMLGINHCILTGPETPFGGVKESGHGSEGGSEGLEAYLVTKYVAQG